jgi:ribonuclease H2 subunit C
MPAPSIVLAPISNLASLKECKPNLMPFHINYSGPAPISTYLLVEPASETVGAPSPHPDQSVSKDEGDHGEIMEGAPKEVDASCASTVTMGTDTKPPSGELAVLPSAERDTASSETLKGGGNTETPEMLNSVRETRLLLETPLAPKPPPTPRLSLAKRVTDATTRFISSFRGRTIQGLKLEVPPGYVGVVLKADDKSSRTTGKARDNMIGKVAKAKAKRRFTRNTTRVIDVDAEEERDMDDAMDVDESSVDPATIRTLVPVSQFSSFVLWHADHPVDEGRDEYFRSLTEWTRLAHEVRLWFFPLHRMKC